MLAIWETWFGIYGNSLLYSFFFLEIYNYYKIKGLFLKVTISSLTHHFANCKEQDFSGGPKYESLNAILIKEWTPAKGSHEFDYNFRILASLPIIPKTGNLSTISFLKNH